jgi:hypothetical protein
MKIKILFGQYFIIFLAKISEVESDLIKKKIKKHWNYPSEILILLIKMMKYMKRIKFSSILEPKTKKGK